MNEKKILFFLILWTPRECDSLCMSDWIYFECHQTIVKKENKLTSETIQIILYNKLQQPIEFVVVITNHQIKRIVSYAIYELISVHIPILIHHKTQ